MWNSTGRSVITVCPDYMRDTYIKAKGSTGQQSKRFQPAFAPRRFGAARALDLALDDGLLAAMPGDHFGEELLAQIHLRLGVVGAVALVAHDFEPEMVQRAAHVVELVLRFDDDFVEAMLDGPQLLLLGERAEEPLAAPVAPRPADPGVEHAPSFELH